MKMFTHDRDQCFIRWLHGAVRNVIYCRPIVRGEHVNLWWDVILIQQTVAVLLVVVRNRNVGDAS